MKVTDEMVDRLWIAHYDYLSGNKDDLRAAMGVALADVPEPWKLVEQLNAAEAKLAELDALVVQCATNNVSAFTLMSILRSILDRKP